MPWAAAAAVVGAAITADGAEGAADDQIAASNAARSDANERFAQARKDQMPFLQTGYGANDLLATRLGLPTQGSTGAAGLSRNELRNQLLPQFTQKVPIINPLTGAVVSPGVAGSNVPGFARNGMTDYFSAESGTASSAPQYNDVIDETALNAEIERQLAGQQNALTTNRNDPAYGSFMRDFTTQDIQNDPVYQLASQGLEFGAQQGVNQLNRRSASMGLLGSGRALKDLTRFSTDYYGAQKAGLAGGAYDRLVGNRTNQFNMLSSISGRGQVGAQGLGSQGLQTAGMNGSYLSAAGDASAAGRVAQGNALNDAVSGLYGAYQQNQNQRSYNGLTNNLYSNNMGWAVNGSLGD